MKKTVWPCVVALNCGLGVACTDDSSPDHSSHDNDGTNDAAVAEQDASTSPGATATHTAGSSITTPGTSSLVDAEAGVADAGRDGAPEYDSGDERDAAGDSGTTDASAAADDAGRDAGPGDAEVYVPDGGVVLRPTELSFDAERLDDLQVPAGFSVAVFANPGGKTRMLAPHNGGIYVTRPEQQDVLRLEDTDGDGAADVTAIAASGYDTVHGILFVEETVYLATPTQLIRGNVSEDGTFADLEVLIDDLPDGGQHPLRTLGIGPDGLLYLSVGSSCDACAETNLEHATILQVALDGSSRTVFASGLRNTIGFGWHPDTDELWGMDNGSDWRGDELPPEELNRIEEGGDYGWPYCYGKQAIDPVIADPVDTTKATYCAATLPSVLENQAHEAPIGLTFYAAGPFPEEYHGDAFVAMHGSWNRIPATGYKIVRVVFDNGQPVAIEDFVTGFLDAAGTATFGRPAGITVDEQGALLFSDDSNGVVYRVSAD